VALLVDADALRREFEVRFHAQFVVWQSPDFRTRSGSLRQHSQLLATGVANGMPPLCHVFGLSGSAMAIALETKGYSKEEQPLA
jgi:hypothetical protein